MLQLTTSAESEPSDGRITLFAGGISSSPIRFGTAVLHSTQCVCHVIDCLQSLRTWRKVLQTSFLELVTGCISLRKKSSKHHLGLLAINLICQAFLALSLPQPCEPHHWYMDPHLVSSDQLMAQRSLIDRTCCASLLKGIGCNSSVQVKLLCKTLI